MKFGLNKDTNLYGLQVDGISYVFFLGNIESMIVDPNRGAMICTMVSSDRMLLPARYFEHLYESWEWYLNGSPDDAVPHELNRDFHD